MSIIRVLVESACRRNGTTFDFEQHQYDAACRLSVVTPLTGNKIFEIARIDLPKALQIDPVDLAECREETFPDLFRIFWI